MDQLQKLADSDEIDTVIVADTDMQGRLYGKRLTVRHFLKAGKAGVNTCSVVLGWGQDHSLDAGYGFTGWDTGYPDFVSIPDLSTLRLCAWHPRTAIVLANAATLDGAAITVSPRAILRRMLDRVRKSGLIPYTASELEFFLLQETSHTTFAKGFVNLETKHPTLHPETVIRMSEDEHFNGELRRVLEGSGIPVEMVKAEYSPGQVELNLEYAEAMESADRHVLFKTAAKELAQRQDLTATFMAKWHSDFGGSSCHIHLSMMKESGGSAFEDSDGGDSDTLRYFLGGLTAHARDFFLFFAPNTNSYKRLVPNTFAPSRITWGDDNRTVAFRLLGSGDARRIENRIPGADVNPYLCYAAMLAAGLYGIENRIDPAIEAQSGNAYAGDGGMAMPGSLTEANEAFAASAVVAETLGEDVRDHYANWGRQTMTAMAGQVTDFERRMLLHDI